MVVYLDVLVFENFVVDLFLLKLTRKLLQIRTSNIKQIVAALLGALYTVTLVFKSTAIFTIVPIQLLVAYIMIAVAFNKSNFIVKLKAVVCYVTLSMLFSGLCVYLSLTNNIKKLLICIIILSLVLDRLVRYIKDRVFVSNYIYDIEIINKGQKYIIKAFLDTGNELREPLTNYPCILVEEDKIGSFNMNLNNCYYINYSAVGCSGKIRGVKCESIRIKEKNGKWREIEAIICPCQNEKFSRENDFNALMPRGII